MASGNNLNLTRVAEFSRKAIYFIAIGFAILALTTYALRQIKEYQRLHPPKIKEYPNYQFGKLPDIQFPEESAPRKKFTLELSSGFFPTSPEVVQVFSFKIQKSTGFDPVESARAFAKKNGFSAGEIKQSDEEYAFVSNENRLKKLVMNVVTQAFEVKSDLKTDYSLLTAYDLPTPTQAILFANQFLQTNNLWLPKDTNNQPAIIYYKILADGSLEKTILPFEANLIKIVFSRDKINDMSTFAASVDDGPVTFLLAGSEDGRPKIAELKYTFYAVDEVNVGKYLAKTPNQAWAELLSGSGFVSENGELDEPIARNIYLGFYDPLAGVGYLQPVWVFEGDKGFRAFVPAVSPK